MNKHYIIISAICAIVFIIGLTIIYSCNLPTRATELRQWGFNITQNGFATLPSIECDHEIGIILDNVTIHIVCRDEMKKPAAGKANLHNEIWVVGRKIGNNFTVNQNILGHEIQHLLNWKCSKIADPDKLAKIGG